MTGELDRLLESLEGVVTSRELAGAGLGHTAITATVRRGRLRRIAQGLYADTAAWEGAPPWERVAAASGVEAGVVPMDAALHRDACTPKDLEAALAHPGTRYGRASARAAVASADGREALLREKRREERLRDAGYRVVRITWDELSRPAALLARITAAVVLAA